jgi:hypothetical protein
MKKISKLIVGILFSGIVASTSFAGEMTVTGGATATYTISGAEQASGKNIGISNELDFTANGELDNGYTWKYQVQLDGDNTSNDDTQLVIGTNYGTVGIYVTEGGLSTELHGVGAMGPGFDYASPATFQTGYDVSSYSNVQYHIPADILPYGITAKVGYAPDLNDTTQLSAKGTSGLPASSVTGRNLTMLQLGASPVDGLSIKGDVAQTGDDTGIDNSKTTGGEEGISANLNAKYTMGPVSLGVVKGGYQPAIASGALTQYENSMMGIQYDVNDSISLSYNVDKSEKQVTQVIAVGASGTTTTDLEMEQQTISVAYTTGGATIGITQIEVDNSDYTTGKDEKMSVISLGISF